MIVEDSREDGDSGFNAGLKVRGVAEGKKSQMTWITRTAAPSAASNFASSCFALASGLFRHGGSAFKY